MWSTGFSAGCCMNIKRFFCTSLKMGWKTLPMFQPDALASSGQWFKPLGTCSTYTNTLWLVTTCLLPWGRTTVQRPSSVFHPPFQYVEDLQEPPEEECRPSLEMLPYTAGVSEYIRRVCRRYGMPVVLRSGRSLRSGLSRVRNSGELLQGHVADPLQPWQGLHWRDQEKLWGQGEGAPGCLPERDTTEVSGSSACVGGSPLHQMGRDHTGRQGLTPWWTATYGGRQHSHDTCWGTPQQGHWASDS